jgi:gamma-butyrobetaine dioxygenase
MTQSNTEYINGYSVYKTEFNPTHVSYEDNTLNVKWDNGENSNYHFLWLRDNCDCNECVTSLSKEQVFEICDVPFEIKPSSVELSSDNMINITWDYEAHQSSYHPGWLKEHCYSVKAREKRYIAPKIWDKQVIEKDLPIYQYESVMNDDKVLLNWLYDQRDFGISKIENVKNELKTVQKVAERISFIRQTNFGTVFNVESKPNANSAAYTNLKLPLHTDLPTRELQPGLQFLHCLVNDASGGESILIDGFKIAVHMRENFADEYKALISLPMSFHNKDKASDYRFDSPMIMTDNKGNITEIRMANFLRGPMNIAADDMQSFYAAYRQFILLTRDEHFQYFHRLNAGDLIAFDNRRVLHARNAFKLGEGNRHLQGCYVDKDELFSRIRVLERGL